MKPASQFGDSTAGALRCLLHDLGIVFGILSFLFLVLSK